MARRTYQAGSVFQKGKNKLDKWDREALAYGRYWLDVPGGGMRRATIPLGVCRTESIAQRKCAECREKLGINSTESFLQSTSSITFRQQAEVWLKLLANRKRDPVEQTTIDTRRYALDKWFYPHIGDTRLSGVNNRVLKSLVDVLTTAKLSAATIRDYSNIVKAVMASAIDENGEPEFPRTWNEQFIDAPIIEDQNQPTTTAEGMKAILTAANGQYRVLYALLAGCGPLRAGEALGLEVKHISKDFRTLAIVQKAKRGVIQQHLKTENGERQVDLCTALADMLREHVGKRTSGLLFCTGTGNQLLQANTLQDSLHPILRGIPDQAYGGFNIFRRFRITHIQTEGCPEVLRHFWSGHAQTHVEERYTKLLEKREYRLDWAQRLGLGFELPSANLGRLGRPDNVVEFRRSA
ncbi:MAG: site-specific integrase [Candidatus Acidiferrum sp.]